jgi:FkbH-like protein
LDFKPEVFFLLFDGYAVLETAPENTNEELLAYLSYAEKLAERFPAAKHYVSTIDFIKKPIVPSGMIRPEYALQYCWESGLDELQKRQSNITVFDMRLLIEDKGRHFFYSEKMWYMGSMPYTMKGIHALVDIINSKLTQTTSARKKVLILDLDNTLWGGVLGEDGVEGIKLSASLAGAVYKDTQRRILELHKTGVLLAIVSKNNKNDVLAAINTHPHMLLREDAFVEIYANWDEKYINIQRLAQSLNLGMDSFVFLDDNNVEREAVRQMLPEVSVVDFPDDQAKLPVKVEQIAQDYFYIEKLTNEDKAKTIQYKEEILRKASRSDFDSLDGYLKSLDIKITLYEMTDSQTERVAQLTQKTNQFNMTSTRFDLAGIREYASKPDNHIFTAEVSDRYGDSGLILVLMLRCHDDCAEIDNFLMSCRVMGRYIEDAVINELESVLSNNYSIETMYAKYIPTTKNVPVEYLMERLDFHLNSVSDDGIKMYSRHINETTSKRKQLYKVKLHKE